MKFCPECGVKLIGQKFCHECGCNISKYLSAIGASSESISSSSSFGGGFDSFDFSALQNAAAEQLSEQKAIESFNKNAVIEGATLVKYNGTDEDVVIPNGITKIKGSAFYNANVKSISIPKSVSEIEIIGIYCSKVECFEVDPENKNYKSIDGVVYSKDGRVLVQYPNGRRGYYSMPNEVESVKRSALTGCAWLSGLTLSNRLTAIDDFMFCGTGFSTINIPSNITSIGSNAFEMCGGLSSITIPGNVTTIGENAFSCCYSLRSVTINEGVVNISRYAFFNCTLLSSVSLPNSLTSIGPNAFQQCKSLPSITIPRGVSTVCSNAFAYCDALSSVTIEEGVRVIESQAFNNYCLKSVRIPTSVQSISDSAFPTIIALFDGGFKMYVPQGRRYGLSTFGREFIDY